MTPTDQGQQWAGELSATVGLSRVGPQGAHGHPRPPIPTGGGRAQISDAVKLSIRDKLINAREVDTDDVVAATREQAPAKREF